MQTHPYPALQCVRLCISPKVLPCAAACLCVNNAASGSVCEIVAYGCVSAAIHNTAAQFLDFVNLTVTGLEGNGGRAAAPVGL